jgi:hypothetical protein
MQQAGAALERDRQAGPPAAAAGPQWHRGTLSRLRAWQGPGGARNRRRNAFRLALRCETAAECETRLKRSSLDCRAAGPAAERRRPLQSLRRRRLRFYCVERVLVGGSIWEFAPGIT